MIEYQKAAGARDCGCKGKGVKLGRPEIAVPKEFPKIVKEWEKKKISFDEVLEKTWMSPSTFYRRLRECRIVQEKSCKKTIKRCTF